MKVQNQNLNLYRNLKMMGMKNWLCYLLLKITFPLIRKKKFFKKINGSNTWNGGEIHSKKKLSGRKFVEFISIAVNSDTSGYSFGIRSNKDGNGSNSNGFTVCMDSGVYNFNGNDYITMAQGNKVGFLVDFKKLKLWVFVNGSYVNLHAILQKKTEYFIYSILYYTGDCISFKFSSKIPKNPKKD